MGTEQASVTKELDADSEKSSDVTPKSSSSFFS